MKKCCAKKCGKSCKKNNGWVSLVIMVVGFAIGVLIGRGLDWGEDEF